MEFFKNGTLADFVENLKKSRKIIEEKVSVIAQNGCSDKVRSKSYALFEFPLSS
jgi:hypothetical protein